MSRYTFRTVVWAASLLLATAFVAQAEDEPASKPAAVATDDSAVVIPASIPYTEDAASEAILSSCDFPTYLPQQIVTAAERYNILVRTSESDLTNVNSGRVLQIKTLYVYAVGGGGFTGRKSTRIRGELRQDGKIIGDFTMQRDTQHAWGACAALRRDADALGRDVAKWLKSPQIGTRSGVQ